MSKKLTKTQKDKLSEQLKVSTSNVGSATKPPIGVMPEIFFKEQRLRDLAAGIYRYVSLGYFGGEYSTKIGIWCNELSRRLNEFR